MARKLKTRQQNLTFPQTCMIKNFEEAVFDFPKESFEQITRRMLGPKGFPNTKNTKLFRSECRRALNMSRRAD
jgi:hypothetical protein